MFETSICKMMKTKMLGYPNIFGRYSGSWDIPTFYIFIKAWDIPSVTKYGIQKSGEWDIPNVTKDGLPESTEKGLLRVITVLQIITPPYGLIIDLSI